MNPSFKSLVALARPQHYLKNVFIFMPLFFSGKAFEAERFTGCILAFATFCLVSSAVYVFNDIMDAEEDRLHPAKRLRPVASGEVSRGAAAVMSAVLLACGLLSAIPSGPAMFPLVLAYLGLNVLYSVKLKHVAILDVFIISIGFVLRLHAGALASNIEPSVWIVIMTFLLALFLALAKRRADLVPYLAGGSRTRRSLDGYNLEMLTASMVIMSAVIIVAYIMYTVSPEVTARTGSRRLYMSVLFVMLGIMRYLQLTFGGGEGAGDEGAGSPVTLVLKDRFLQLTILGWLMTCGIILYR